MITSGHKAEDSPDALGTNWTVVSPDLPAICHGAKNCMLVGAHLSCGSQEHCMALPVSSPVTLAWNGTTWAAVQLVRSGGHLPELTAPRPAEAPAAASPSAPT